MKIDHILTFLEISDCGNFNRAAENLNITQSTVSARIKTIEDHLGQLLFKRSHSGVELTPAGQQFRPYAVNMQRLWHQAQQRVALADNFTESIGLGCQVNLWESLVINWIPWMREHARNVAIHVEIDYSPSLMRQLVDGVLDIGVMYNPRSTPGFKIETLLEETLVLVSTRPVAVDVINESDYVFVDWGHEFRQRHSEAFPDMQTPALSVGLGTVGLEYLLQNSGAGYFPARVVEPYCREGRLFPVPDSPEMKRPAFLVYSTSSHQQVMLQQAVDGLHEIARLHAETPISN